MSFLPERPADRVPESRNLVPISIFLFAGVVYLLLTALMVSTHRFEFLAGYLAAGIGTLVGSIVMRRRSEGGEIPRIGLSDPYLIGYLRGGTNEVVRLATISLIERRLLRADGNRLTSIQPIDFEAIKEPIERRILGMFATTGEAKTLFDDPQLKQYCENLHAELAALGFLPDIRTQKARSRRVGVAVFFVLGIAVTKIIVALSQGHHNLAFTVLLAVFFLILLLVTGFPPQIGRAHV